MVQPPKTRKRNLSCNVAYPNNITNDVIVNDENTRANPSIAREWFGLTFMAYKIRPIDPQSVSIAYLALGSTN